MAGPVTGSPGTGTYYKTGKPGKVGGLPGNSTKPGAKGVVGVVPSVGGRDQSPAKKAAAAAAKSRGNKSKLVTDPTVTPPQTTPTVPTGNPEDTALANVSTPDSPGYGVVGNGGTNLAGQFDPAAYAKGMSGMQYDPQIVQVASRIKGIINALPGSMESLHKAFGNLRARAANPVQQGVLGGNTGATAGAYATATAGNANDAANAQANAQASREADWASRIRLMSDANVNNLRGTLGGLTQSKADAQVGYYNQGIKTKSDLTAQGISNINSIRASNAAMAMVQGNLEQQGAKTTSMNLTNENNALLNQYLPLQLQQGLIHGNQNTTASAMSIDQAKLTLKQNVPAKNLATALTNPQASAALTSMATPPPGGLVQDANGYSHVRGDPNVWVKNNVARIMSQLPKSSRANVTQFVNQQIGQAISVAGGWTQNKNGKWIRPK